MWKMGILASFIFQKFTAEGLRKDTIAMSNIRDPWENVLELLHNEVSNFQYNTWFKPMKPVMIDQDHMLILLDDKFIVNLVKQRHQLMIKNAVAISYGGIFRSISPRKRKCR